MKAYWGSGGIAPRIFTSSLDGVESSALHPNHFTPRGRAPSTHWIGGWVGPRAGLDAVVKWLIRSPCRDSTHPPRSSCPKPSDIPLRYPDSYWRSVRGTVFFRHHHNCIRDVQHWNWCLIEYRECKNEKLVGLEYDGRLKISWTGRSAPLLCRGRRWLLCQVVVVGVT
jgi:hypothetical protein